MLFQPVLVALAVAVVGLAPGTVVGHIRANPKPAQLGITDPAKSACARMDRVVELVSADASYLRVLVEVAEAKEEAARATDNDSSWRPLLGAVGAIDAGLQHNDAQASSIGIDVVHYACRDVTAGAHVRS